MNILMLWHAPYPWDVRLEKFINALSPEHKLFVLCKGKEGLPLSETLPGAVVDRVWAGNKLLSYQLFCNPFWTRALDRALSGHAIDAVIVRDLPLMRLGIKAARGRCIPVVFDMAENYPAALVAYEKWYYKPFLAGGAALPKLYEKYAVREADRVFVVTEEQRERVAGLGAKAENIALVSNTPVLSELPAHKAAGGGQAKILYTGKVDIHRGVGTAVEALSKLAAKHPGVRLIVAGSGRDLGRLKELASKLGCADKVEFTGWVQHSKVYELISESDICLIPHLKSEHTDTTLPNKLFDYMALGKPVVSSDLAPVARILKECACGVTYRSGDAADLAGKIGFLISGRNAPQFGENGRRAVASKYNWDADAGRLRDAVRKLR